MADLRQVVFSHTGHFHDGLDFAEKMAEFILNEQAGSELQCAEIADRTQLCGQMQFHEITGNIRLRQELPERGIVRSGCGVFFLHQPWLRKMTRRWYHSPEKANIGGERNCHSFRGPFRGWFGPLPKPSLLIINYCLSNFLPSLRYSKASSLPP